MIVFFKIYNAELDFHLIVTESIANVWSYKYMIGIFPSEI